LDTKILGKTTRPKIFDRYPQQINADDDYQPGDTGRGKRCKKTVALRKQNTEKSTVSKKA